MGVIFIIFFEISPPGGVRPVLNFKTAVAALGRPERPWTIKQKLFLMGELWGTDAFRSALKATVFDLFTFLCLGLDFAF